MYYNQINLLPLEPQDLISECNVEHRENMKPIFNELLKCVMCGDIKTIYTERIYIDQDIDTKRVICCSDDCQENFYYKKRNYLKTLRAHNN
jgi:hypothetical protein